MTNVQVPSAVIEDKVLTLLTLDKMFGCAIMPYMQEALFAKPHNKLYFKILKDFYTEFSTAPSFEAFANEIKKRQDIIDERTYTVLGETAYKVFSAGLPEDAAYIKREVSAFIKMAAMRSAIAKSGILVEQGQIEAIVNEFEQAKLAGAILSKPPIELFDTIDTRIKDREIFHTQKKIATGFPALDNDLRGGLGIGELGVVFGGYNVGKSMLLQQFMKNGADAGKRGLFISLEMSALEVFNRLEANITGIPMDDLITRADEIRAQKDALLARHRGLIYVQEFPTGSLDVNTLPAIINQFHMLHGQLDVVYLDYADIMKVNQRGDLRLELKDIYIKLRAIARECDVAIWTVSQVNREGLKASTVRGSHANESIDKLFIADIVVSINQSENEYPDRARVWVEKNRRSRKWQERTVRCTFPLARFEMHDGDQVEMSATQHTDIQAALRALNTDFGGNNATVAP